MLIDRKIAPAKYPVGIEAKKKWFVLPAGIDKKGGSYHEDMAFLLGFLCGDGCYSPGVKG